MSVATETEQTTKHFVDLWQRETILRRKQIVIEAPTGWDAQRLAALDAEELSRLADEYVCESDWELEDVEDCEFVDEIHISGPVPDRLSADIMFVEDESGELIEAESGDPAAFDY